MILLLVNIQADNIMTICGVVEDLRVMNTESSSGYHYLNEKSTFRSISPAMETIVCFPPEVSALICSFLNQYEKLSLACTSRRMAEMCLDRIYERVVVDSKYTQFSKEFVPSLTYVNLLYNFKKLMKSQRVHAIKSLQVVSLPDLISIHEKCVKQEVKRFFSHLEHLHELRWILDYFSFDYLRELPHQETLTHLEIDISNCNWEKELTKGFLETEAFYFPNLISLLVRPFRNLTRLVDLLSALLRARNGYKIGAQLCCLKVARVDELNALLPVPATLIAHPIEARADDEMLYDFELDTIDALFLRCGLGYLSELTQLSLDNIFVCEDDAHTLRKTVNLSKIRRLELREVSEHELGNTNRVGFLGELTGDFPSMEQLHLDYREAAVDTVGAFLHSVPHLESLDLVVRLNEIKETELEPAAMFEDYGKAIASMKQLVHICVEVRASTPYCEYTEAAPIKFIRWLRTLRKLRSIRVSVDTHEMDEFLDLLRSHPRLEMLDISASRSDGAPAYGLSMVQPNIFSEWFKVRHVALLCWRAQNALRYIRVHQCVFEFENGSGDPRDGIDRWFDSRVRVGFYGSPDA